ncbi:type II toxin-antitoxin system HicA family toxin [Candidatus Peregrinibacteria bacterium]|nr:type II toxin-antitoxin system HicA family toxin [Candidatus Peregrinibacteria bacterium]MBT4055598.1 type II toxin-antitoxin system HicA family toxin [Candidatus Peregrinibacteria bacterium]
MTQPPGKEDTSFSAPELSALDDEQIEEILSARPIPTIATIIGQANVDRIYDLLATPDVACVDKAALGSEFGSVKELHEYIRVSPDQIEVDKAVRDLVVSIMEQSFGPRIGRWMDALVVKIRKIQGSTKVVRKCRVTCARAVGSQMAMPSRERAPIKITETELFSLPVINLFKEIDAMAQTMEISHKSQRNVVVLMIRDLMDMYLAHMIISEFSNSSRTRADKDTITNVFEEANKAWLKTYGRTFPVMSLIFLLKEIIDVVGEDKANKAKFKQFLENAEETEEVPFDLIQKLSEYRKSTPHTAKIGDCEVRIFGDEFETHHSDKICYVSVIVDESKPVNTPEAIRSEDGITTKTRANEGSIHFALNRYTGELTLFGQYMPLSFVIGSEQYEKLKKIVYKVVFDYLIDKDPDINDYLIGASLDEAFAKKRQEDEAAAEALRVKTAYAPYEAVPKQEPTPASTEEQQAETRWAVKKAQGKVLRGISGEEVNRTLLKIERVSCREGEGSHRIFRINNGPPATVSRHRKDIPIGTLLSILKILGISQEEFKAAI